MKTSFARDMLDRTQEGTAALLRAVCPAFTGRDHFTLGALAAGETAAWSGLFTWRTLGTATTVAAPVFLALRPDCSPETRVGLVAAALGQASKRGKPTTFGVTCVSVQYAAFAWQSCGRVGGRHRASSYSQRTPRHGCRWSPSGCAFRASR